MKKVLIPLLVMMMLCISLAALAEGIDTITVELKTDKLPVYEADDPVLAVYRAEGTEENTLPVILAPVKQSMGLRVTVLPQNLKNRKSTMTVDNEDVARIRENTLYTRNAGETVLTIASVQDPSVTVQYRVIVYQPVTRISLTASAKEIAVGQTISLTPSVLPENAAMKDVTWISQDEKERKRDRREARKRENHGGGQGRQQHPGQHQHPGDPERGRDYAGQGGADRGHRPERSAESDRPSEGYEQQECGVVLL